MKREDEDKESKVSPVYIDINSWQVLRRRVSRSPFVNSATLIAGPPLEKEQGRLVVLGAPANSPKPCCQARNS
jgi:hypothetical protein